MPMQYQVEDETHWDLNLRFATLTEAVAELHRRAHLPWNDADNVPPCADPYHCEREYWLTECDAGGVALRRIYAFTLGAAGLSWNKTFEEQVAAWEMP